MRRSSAGRYNRGPFAGQAATRATVLQQPVTTEVRTSTVPCSGSDVCVAEDWDAECVPLEPGTPGIETKTDTTEAHTTVNSTDINDGPGTDVNQVHDTS